MPIHAIGFSLPARVLIVCRISDPRSIDDYAPKPIEGSSLRPLHWHRPTPGNFKYYISYYIRHRSLFMVHMSSIANCIQYYISYNAPKPHPHT